MGSRPDGRGSEVLPTGLWSERTEAVALALFVTLLWSSSYVLITIGLEELRPLTFAGLRYTMAATVLLAAFLASGRVREVRHLNRRDLASLLVLGLLLYGVTQGAQFAALVSLRAATVSLVLSFTPAVVALAAVPVLGERPSRRQWVWITVLLVGVGVYFHPCELGSGAALGVAFVVVALCANALGAVLGRLVNRDEGHSPLAVTTLSMTVGSVALLATGVAVEGPPSPSPSPSPRAWAIVVWLAVVNTALAFTLWNRTLRTLSATASSAINNTMLVQVAVLGWVFLGESLDALEVVGLLVVAIGAMAVQVAD